jgi:hypothetical protein
MLHSAVGLVSQTDTSVSCTDNRARRAHRSSDALISQSWQTESARGQLCTVVYATASAMLMLEGGWGRATEKRAVSCRRASGEKRALVAGVCV